MIVVVIDIVDIVVMLTMVQTVTIAQMLSNAKSFWNAEP